MKSLFILMCLVQICYYSTVASEIAADTTVTRDEIITYLIDCGYLESSTYSKHELRRSLRQFQRENDMLVNGRITPEIHVFVQNENDKKMVLEYLKVFGYIQGAVSPVKTTDAIKMLQQNSGVLTKTGLIDTPTINFIKTHKHGFSEGLYAR